MKRFFAAVLTAMACCAVTLFAACVKEGDKQPEKLKDGVGLTLTEGESKSIDLSEYISIEGTGYVYTANSSAPNIATVSVDGNIASVTAVAEGGAVVSAAAGEVSVEFTVTVSAKQSETPDPVVADKTALAEELALEITEQGDYTEESFAAYTLKLEAAKAVNAKTDATQDEVDTACNELKAARLALALRVPEEVDGAEKTLVIISGGSGEITVSDYIDGKNLSDLSYEISAGNALVTVSEISGDKFTVTAGETEEDINVALSICARYKGETKLTVTITLQIKSEAQPVVKHTHISSSVDVYKLENKNELTIDFTENVESNGVENLVYSVTADGASVTLDGSNRLSYKLDGNYSEEATEVVFNVTVSYGEGKSVGYVYTLKITDTSAYRVANGGFETGDLTGWTLSNTDLGGVNAAATYWAEEIPFNNDGYFFNAYYFDGEAKEDAMGTLTSSAFEIGGSGWITYKLGGAKNADKVYVDIIEKTTGNILARYYNNTFSDDGVSLTVRGCTLVEYRADLSEHIGKTVYIRISDNAVRDYGLFFADSFETYYEQTPEAENTAVAVANAPSNIYQLLNGGFETGDLTGWELTTGEVPGKVSNLTGYWGDNHNYNKDGEWLFTGAEGQSFETDPNLEYRMGTLRSNVFTLKAGGWISFKLGGTINVDATNIKVVKADGTVLAVFHNTNPASPEGGLVQYTYRFADLAEDTECYIEFFDNATEGWGLIVADSFITDYAGEPQLEGAVTAINKNN